MPKKRLWLALANAGLMGLWATVAQAAVLGAGSGGATLGQGLDFSVSVRLGADEAQAVDCFVAEVQVGDRRLLPSQLRVWVEPAGAEMLRVRVQTRAAIDEPVVSLTLAAVCGNPGARRYVVMADPPGVASASAMSLVPASAAVALSPPPVDTVALSDRPSAAWVAPSAERSTGHAVGADSVVLPGSAWHAVALRGPAAAGGVRKKRRAMSRQSVQPLAVASPQVSPRKRRQTASSLPRLRLDIPEPLLTTGGAVEQALQAVAQATAAARQSASAASAAADRIAALERTVDQLRGDAQSSRSQAALLRDQLAQAEGPTSTWVLSGAAVAMGLLAGWLAVRLSATRRALIRAWENATPAARQASMAAESAERPPTAAMAFVHSNIDSTATSPQRTRPAPAWPPPVPLDGWLPSQSADGEAVRSEQRLAPNTVTAALPRAAAAVTAADALATAAAEVDFSTRATAVLPPLSRDETSQARDVSIDELLDLEQQAEFFVVLGQDDAAIELLVEHLRHTGGGSPLPYLKLLEIHRRRGDRSDYERVRARFNHRFNGYAPEWEVDLQSGLSLDAYPGVLPRLQKVWQQPQNSMAELEAMLFRKSNGELFDLPAYREVLLLYALARDLLDRESTDAGEVDVLLPLHEQSDFSNTSPSPFVDLRREVQAGAAGSDPRSAASVDLDLSLDSGRPTSIFDPLQETPTLPRIR